MTASSTFLIYLDPLDSTNSARTLVIAQLGGAFAGSVAAVVILMLAYWAAEAEMLAIIALMIVLDTVHPSAVSTSLSFAFRAGPESNLLLFALESE